MMIKNDFPLKPQRVARREGSQRAQLASTVGHPQWQDPLRYSLRWT